MTTEFRGEKSISEYVSFELGRMVAQQIYLFYSKISSMHISYQHWIPDINLVIYEEIGFIVFP